MASTKTRSFVKGLAWELSAPLILFVFTREWHVILGYTVARTVLYFFYERLWKKICWGKG